MHRSRIGIVLLDHPEGSYDDALAFWAATSANDAGEQKGAYAALGWLGGSLKLEAQRIGNTTPARVHLDIESDDVPAEIARLQRLGAVVAEDRGDYSIMHDPGGLVFCVVPVQTGDAFDKHAVTWA